MKNNFNHWRDLKTNKNKKKKCKMYMITEIEHTLSA